MTETTAAYKTTVGIEVHAELKTESKMFCGCTNAPHEAKPNTYVCPVCMAHPGTLPTVNKEAVRFLMMIGRAINGTLAEYSEFDRKNYFYPDIPKGYQISQYKFPFVVGGEIAGVKIRRVHLEEDTARSQHDQGAGSLIDYNRAGVPLMELVTEPVIHDAKTAGEFARELRLLLRTLGISDANMERGEMRVEANISVSQTDELGTLTEVKNLNSIKAMEAAIAYETKRHIEVLQKGETLTQETRGWDENRGKTFAQRSKETAEDYRYFPDPDIPKVDRAAIDEFSNSRIDDILPVLPQEKRSKYENLGIPSSVAEIIISDVEMNEFFEQTLLESEDNIDTTTAAHYLTSDITGVSESEHRSLANAHPSMFAELLSMLKEEVITSRVAKDLIPEVVFEGKDPRALAEERNLLQQNDSEELIPVVDTILSEHAAVVDEYKGGKESALQFLVGQGMKVTKGSANPKLLADLIKERIG